MERPEIKDKKILEYVEDLERQLDNFKPDRTRVNSYLGLKNVVDQLNMINKNVILVLEEENEDNMTPEQKKTALRERRLQQEYIKKTFETVGEIEKYNDMLDRMEKKINPDMLQKEVQKGAGAFEKVIKERESK